MSLVSMGQLFGGKICAALDRQHPRDLFDIKYLFKNEGFTEQIKTGFLLALLSSPRPMDEILFPHLLDQQAAMTNQFKGMSSEPFSYTEFEQTRDMLISTIHSHLTFEDKLFIVDFKEGNPNWNVYDFERFPAVQWKLKNIRRLKENNLEKHTLQVSSLKKQLGVGGQ